jgi:signal transduction histidine kinase
MAVSKTSEIGVHEDVDAAARGAATATATATATAGTAGALEVNASAADDVSTAATIRGLAVTTLDELRQMLRVLRDGEQPDGERAVLADLPGLIAASGIAFDARFDLPADLPIDLQPTIYRTVQEALTNVRKHAPGAEAAGRAAVVDGSIVLTITNDVREAEGEDRAEPGHGLIGLRERAELSGGTFAAAVVDGRFRLTLTLPVADA